MQSYAELSHAQSQIWTMEQFIGGAVSVITGSILFSKDEFKWEKEKITNAVTELYRVNEALRIQIIHQNGKIFQVKADAIPPMMEEKSFSSQAELECYAKKAAAEPMDLKGPLCLFQIIEAPGKIGLLVRIHHLIGDAWTLSLLANQFQMLIEGSGKISSFSYMDYLVKEQTYLKSNRFQKDLDFYRKQYQKNDNLILHQADPKDDYHAERLSFVIDGEMTESIKRIAQEADVTLFSVLMTLYAVCFSRMEMNADHFYFGTTLLNRYGAVDRNTAGMFVNTVPVAIALEQEQPFSVNMSEVHQTLSQVMRHGHCTYTDILKELRSLSKETENLFDVSVNYQNARIMPQENAAFETVWYPSCTQAEALQINIEDRDDTGSLHIHYDYRTACFQEKEIIRLQNAVSCLIHQVAADTGTAVCKLRMTNNERYEKLLNQKTVCPWPFEPENLGEWFRKLAEADRDFIVLECADKAVSYGELQDASDLAAQALIRRGAQQGRIVALKLSRRSQLPIMILAVIKTGAAFLLIDPDCLQDRIDYMLHDSQACMIIDDSEALNILKEASSCQLICQGSPSSLCYAIYTSGSTGNPKGVLISQGNIINNIFWRRKAYPERRQRIISVTNVTADTFLEDFFYALYTGNTFCLVENRRDLFSIHAAVGNENRRSSIMTTPTFFSTIIERIPPERFQAVTLVGEVLEKTLAERILAAGCQLHNEYGPSECTICATHALLTSDDISIGKPIDNAHIYILDRYLQPVDIGIRGELCISGELVGMGYMGLPDLNKKQFVLSPDGKNIMYRTGDIAYWTDDWNIQIVGRIDNQVKIRGQRVELGEIEQRISELEGVENTAVVVRKGAAGQQVLCAFYTGKEWKSDEMIQTLEHRLPAYMVPQIITYLKKIPVNPSGKVNRKLLPEVDLNQIALETVYEPPVTWQEQVLCRIASEVLNIPAWGLSHHFFHQGGDSLKAMEFVMRAEQEGILIKLQDIFDYPTVKNLVKTLDISEKSHVTYNADDFAAINRMLSGNPAVTAQGSVCQGDMLLTGATGFLGCHILEACHQENMDTIWCIVRGKNCQDAESRLSHKLTYYFGSEKGAQIMKHVRVLCGDLRLPGFGLMEEEYNQLKNTVSKVIHAAGNVKHYGHSDIFTDNVLFLRNIIIFCQQASAVLVHCSTTSIGGNTPTGEAYCENDFYVGQQLDNIYIHSKFEAEKNVLDAMAKGLPACVVRLGNLTNRTTDGVFQENYDKNAFLRRIHSIVKLGVFPEHLVGIRLDFTPVDKAAAAIVHILKKWNDRLYVYHLCSDGQITIADLIQAMRENGIRIDIVSKQRFDRLMSKSAAGLDMLAADLNGEGQLEITEENISCRKTLKWFEKNGFSWFSPNHDYLVLCIRYYKNIGFLGGEK